MLLFYPSSFLYFAAHAVGISHRGNMRAQNEDNVYYKNSCLPQQHTAPVELPPWSFTTKHLQVFGVFDGMGGESAGDLASYTAAAALQENIRHMSMNKAGAKKLLQELNRQVYERGRTEKYRLIGTTAVLLLLKGRYAVAANVGDSPLFRWRSGNLTQLSEIHTDAALLEKSHCKRKPGLTQFLGMDESEMLLEPYIVKTKLRHGDFYLLCSDGLTDKLSSDEIGQVLRGQESVERKAKVLLQKALERGNTDNITILLCGIE